MFNCLNNLHERFVNKLPPKQFGKSIKLKPKLKLIGDFHFWYDIMLVKFKAAMLTLKGKS